MVVVLGEVCCGGEELKELCVAEELKELCVAVEVKDCSMSSSNKY